MEIHLSNEESIKGNVSEEEPVNAGSVYIYTIILVFTSFVILALNIPILIILIAAKCLGKRIRNIHILSLSISDMLVGINIIPFSVILQTSINDYASSYNECWSRMCIYLTCLTASFFHLLFICIDRCWIISRKKLSSTQNTKIRLYTSVIVSWVSAVLCIIVPFTVLKYERPISHCSIKTVFKPEQGVNVLRIWSVIFSNGMLLVFTACFWMIKKIVSVKGNSIRPEEAPTTSIYRGTIASQKVIRINVEPIKTEKITVSNLMDDFQHSQISRSQRNVIKTITMLAVSLGICIMPIITMALIEGWFDSSLFSSKVRHIIVYIASLNSATNPIIYAFRIDEVRQSIKTFKQKISCCHVYCVYNEQAT